MADVKITASPLVPTVDVELEIGGKLEKRKLRYDFLAQEQLAQEAEALKIDVEAMQRAGGSIDQFKLVALTIKHFLWPRDHDLSTDQILSGLSFPSLAYMNQKVDELFKLNGLDLGNPQKGRGRSRSRAKKSGKPKPPPESVSDSITTSSGTPPLPN